MTENRVMIAERLSRYYTESLCKNPKNTIFDNVLFAVESLPVVATCFDVLESARELLKTLSKDERDARAKEVAELCAAIIRADSGVDHGNA